MRSNDASMEYLLMAGASLLFDKEFRYFGIVIITVVIHRDFDRQLSLSDYQLN